MDSPFEDDILRMKVCYIYILDVCKFVYYGGFCSTSLVGVDAPGIPSSERSYIQSCYC